MSAVLSVGDYFLFCLSVFFTVNIKFYNRYKTFYSNIHVQITYFMANNTLQHKQFLCKTVFRKWGLALCCLALVPWDFWERYLQSYTVVCITRARLMKHSWSFINIFYLFHELSFIFLSSKKSRKKICILVLVLSVIIVILGFILWLVNKWSDCLQPSHFGRLFSRASACWRSCQNKLIIRKRIHQNVL